MGASRRCAEHDERQFTEGVAQPLRTRLQWTRAARTGTQLIANVVADNADNTRLFVANIMQDNRDTTRMKMARARRASLVHDQHSARVDFTDARSNMPT